MFCVGSPAKVAMGMGAMAVYIYSLNILPYTVKIIINDKTVINRLPSSVTIQRGIESNNPTLSIFSTISAGSSITSESPPNPEFCMIVDTIPCMTEKSAIINSSPYPTAPFASANRINNFTACSGFFTSR